MAGETDRAAWLSLVLEEYKTLREESLAAMQMQQSSLTFGTATVGVVISAGLSVWDKPALPEIVFLIFVPLIVCLTLLIWAGEVARMFRVGAFLARLEERINSQLPEMRNALTWETWLATSQDDGRTAHSRLRPLYVSVYLLFVTSDLVSVIIGLAKIAGAVTICEIVALLVVEVALLSVVVRLAQRMSKTAVRWT